VTPGQQTPASAAPKILLQTLPTSSVTMFFIYGNLNFVPGGYDPVRIIPVLPRARDSMSIYVLYSQPSKTLWNPFSPFVPPPY
jgi:hypothetical protein